MIKYLLFYGTLMSAAGSRGMRHEPQLTKVSNVTIKGTLFNTGGFPALVMGGENTDVQCELYKINDYSKVLTSYDGIEGYRGSKDNDLYTRTVVHVLDPTTNEFVDAWVYTWNRSTTGLSLIESGSWLDRG